MSIKIKQYRCPYSKNETDESIISTCMYFAFIRHTEKIVNYVTGNVLKVVPGENLPSVFSSETTICDLYDKENINQQTCYKNMFPYHFREGII